MNGDNGTSTQAPQMRALLFTDLCDSLILVERIGDAAAAELFQAHDRLVLALQQQWNGHQIDRSDGLFLLFERPIDALGFALDYHAGLGALGRSLQHPIRARAGLHVGEVILWDNSAEAIALGSKPVEVEGLAKPMAARLMQLARPGQILVSATAESMVRRAGVGLRDKNKALKWTSFGRWRFKGVAQPMDVFGVMSSDMPSSGRPRATSKAVRDLPFWRQPTAMVAEATLAVALLVGAWMMTRSQPAIAFAERDWVVLSDVTNQTGEPIFDDSLRQAMLLGLEQSKYVNVLSDGKVRESLELARDPVDAVLDRSRAVDVAVREGARAVLVPKVIPRRGGYEVQISLIDPGKDVVIQTYTALASGTGNAVEAVDKVIGELRAGLGESVAGLQRSMPLPSASTASLRALRSYALAETALGERRFNDARNLYQTALEIDPAFALAYIGLAKSFARTADRSSAREQLEKALALKGRLPHREQLYLKGWQAELEPGGWPVEQWRVLAGVYPDFYAGPSNTSWYLIQDNRFQEAEPFARAASVPQDYLRIYPMVHLARIQLARNQFHEAQNTLQQARTLRRDGIDDTQVDVLVGLRRYAEARRLVERMGKGEDALQDLMHLRAKVLLAADQGDCDAMRSAVRQDVAKPGLADYQIHQKLVHATVEALCGGGSKGTLSATATQLIPLLKERDHPNIADRSLQLLALVYLAQREGQHPLADTLLRDNAALLERQHSPVVAKWRRIVSSNALLIDGKADAAVEMLQPLLDGSEPVQAHVVLLQARRAQQDGAGVLQEQQWLATHRGQAIAEVAAIQVWQPLNAHDVATWSVPVKATGMQ